MNNVAAIVEQKLQRLIGLQLSLARRAANMRNFHFGTVRPFARGTTGEYALHIQCPWRIETDARTVTGYTDLWRPLDEGELFDAETWSYEDGNLQDERLSELLRGCDEATRTCVNETHSLVVEAVTGDACGGAMLQLSGGYRLVLSPCGSTGEDWRLFRPESDEPHFVIVGGKVEEE